MWPRVKRIDSQKEQIAQRLGLSNRVLKMYLVPRLKDIVQNVDNMNEQIGIQQMETKKKSQVKMLELKNIRDE